jgi:hypothetical protein
VNEVRVELKNKRFCFTGINFNNSGLSFEQQSNSLIWFLYIQKETHFVLIKAKSEQNNN